MYEQITQQIRDAVYSKALNPGDALPSLRQLAKDLQVSMITTTRAYNDLAAEGLIVNQPGRGSFVLALDEELVQSELRARMIFEAQQLSGTAHLAGFTLQDTISAVADAFQEQENR